VNVVERGSGPPVVLVHGLPGCAYDWRVLTDALAARGRRAIAYDRVGYGRSDARAGAPHTIEQNGAELLALLEALDLRQATVVGWSYGGATAIAAAHRDPSRMARLVLVGSSGPGIEEEGPPPAMALATSRPVLTWLRAVPPVSSAVRASISDAAYSGQPQPEWWLPSLAANLARPHTSPTYAAEMRGLAASAVPDPTGIDLPVLVIHGDDDRLVPVAIGRELARRAKRSRLVVIEGGSHMLPVTHAERTADEIVASGAAEGPA
jgi:pimeloyl-ACP methyl ester carboxylesterase